ncbi:protein neprosin-like [Typha latifolia]|uniref:protein neprosin-like n=1 Tax=Typha latifolia TaxID=4733 RepID=UPI003C2EAA7A
MEKIKQYLEKINKPAVKSIQSPDGDIVDCIPIDKQPAFDNPLLKNHTIQMAPSAMPTYTGENYTTNTESVRQVWNDAGSCPDGTVPIRRITVGDVLRAKSLSQFGKKKRNYISRTATVPTAGPEYAVAYPQNIQSSIYGTSATLNVWDSYVESDDELSLSKLLLSSNLDIIEAGWQVYPRLYGDRRARLFVHWTSDGYQSTGCYDHLCPGFVQIDARLTPGATVSPVSTYAGPQFEATYKVLKDPSSGNWWMYFQGIYVGYWPAILFTQLSYYATWVEWGGEIANIRRYGVHTETDMGSGHFAGEGFGKACYIKNLWTADWTGQLYPVQSITTYADHPNCYNAISYNGVSFYFGGPGRNSLCP